MEYVVIESHPNIGGYWVGAFRNNKKKIIEYLKRADLDYIYVISELKENGQDVTDKFLEWDDENFCFSRVKL